MTTKRDEHRRNYKLKGERCQQDIKRIDFEFLSTEEGARLWTLAHNAVMARLEKLKAELLAGARDRSAPGIVQGHLQRVIYAALNDLAAPSFVDRALGKRGRS